MQKRSGSGIRLSLDLLVEQVRTSLWLVPVVMLLGGVVLFYLAQWLDGRQLSPTLLQSWWLHSGTGGDARNLMSTMVTTIITMSSVVFSMTIVALTLAATQFGSRLVRSYLKDLRTRLTLGAFLMTVLYCQLALRLVTEEMSPAQVPHVTVTLGLALSMACVITLLFFLNAVARSIIADEVVRRVAADLDQSIEELPARQDFGPQAAAGDLPSMEPGREGAVLRSDDEGYIEAIEYEALAGVAAQHDLELHLSAMPGDYMCRGGWLGSVRPPANCSDEALEAMRENILIGPERTPVQDLRFSIRHLVDVALRALSPGINDANTAMVVIDHLRGAMSRLLEKSLPTGVFRDADGRVRLVAPRLSHAELIGYAFQQIRHAAAPQPTVVIAMLQAFAKLVEHALDPAQRVAILDQAELAASACVQRAPLSGAESEIIPRELAAVRRKAELAEKLMQPPHRRGLSRESSGLQGSGRAQARQGAPAAVTEIEPGGVARRRSS